MDLVKLPDVISDREFNWSEEAQGFASGGGYWFVTQKPCLRRLPNTKPLASDFGDRLDIPGFLQNEHYDHFGDPDFSGGRIFVPLEGKVIFQQFQYHLRPRLCAFDVETWKFLGWASFPDQATNAPWVAVHPVSGLVYSSHDHPDIIFGHHVEIDQYGLTMKTVSRTPLLDESGARMSPGQVQGGAFTPDGKFLFLSVKADNLEIQCYEMPTGRRVKRKFLSTDGILNDLENEGIMIVDQSVSPVHPRWTLFVIILNNDHFESDNVSVQCFQIRTGTTPPTHVPT